MLARRVQRFCLHCGTLLRQRDGEQLGNFLNREHCNTTCANFTIKKKQTGGATKCFCGGDTGSRYIPYCCWDHRIIAARCKQWDIPLTLKDYSIYANRLEEEQRILDAY